MVDVVVVGIGRDVVVTVMWWWWWFGYSRYNQEGPTPFSSSRHAYMPRLLCWAAGESILTSWYKI